MVVTDTLHLTTAMVIYLTVMAGAEASDTVGVEALAGAEVSVGVEVGAGGKPLGQGGICLPVFFILGG